MMNNIIQMIKSSGNSQMMLNSMVQQQAKVNPIMNTVLQMMQGNNMSGIEQIARNVCISKGLNPDEVLKNIKQQFNA